MATYEKIEQELNRANNRLDEAIEELKQWKKGKYKGKKLEEWEIALIEGNLSEAKKTEKVGDDKDEVGGPNNKVAE
ncbi:5206_t:CDS:2 [Funneliformis mosseae]|uniref:5206_t:CDS:1 n=1 Tax=Funneliformis mosseae TaxID=27381 RepID=A0A9N8VSE8_FUNMO|nr:5206_t:CDS:2 [Funneliformis mosseae]